jgi:hypothetical protein
MLMYESSELDKRILKTLIYFDLFNFPLTSWEIWKWLLNDTGQKVFQVELLEVIQALEQGEYLKNKLTFRKGFYYLRGRDRIVEERLDKYIYAWQKFRIVRRVAGLLKMIPFIKLIAVCNDLAYFNAPEESDLDFFIITAKNRIWTTRFAAVLLTKLFGLRPSPKSKKNKICLSVYVSEDKLNLEDLKISADDLHFAYWLENLIPVYDSGGYYQKLREANIWIGNYLPQRIAYDSNFRQRVNEGGFCRFIKKLSRYLVLNADEKIYRWYQKRKFSEKIKELLNLDTRVVVNDNILKFHTNDNRLEVGLKFKQKCGELL